MTVSLSTQAPVRPPHSPEDEFSGASDSIACQFGKYTVTKRGLLYTSAYSIFGLTAGCPSGVAVGSAVFRAVAGNPFGAAIGGALAGFGTCLYVGNICGYIMAEIASTIYDRVIAASAPETRSLDSPSSFFADADMTGNPVDSSPV
ncbi:hypothetical protein [Endozoicomonas sp. SCSIO W0465]|uniref:hypothetical protein n=1 Tax=Endozoicomonas sp. SCSIO W0465 TaxID=2918516 RepID=UPI002074FC71|nr:hypothetical protein [Endozoicomonas sp. SCSIO W0465]USE38718.1 hypothetical protein MJO57_11410 [Endozoicomonas sp. SCSIO W0465]